MMKSIDPDTLSPRALYQLIIATVIPRPIAWISTQSKAGVRNLAPFSFFNAMSGAPPIVAVSIGNRGGIAKDTLKNLMETNECVIHMVTAGQAQQMNITSTDWPAEVDEFTAAKLETIAADLVTPPRIAAAPVAMEGRLLQTVPLAQTGYTLCLVQLLRLHIAETLLRPNGTVDPTKLNPVARLGGSEYALLSDFFDMQRPAP